MLAFKPNANWPRKLYEIDCPVRVEIDERASGSGIEEGRLQRIGVGSARCTFPRAMPLGAHVALHVYFAHPRGIRVVVVFDAVVTRARNWPPCPTTFRFTGRAKFLENQLANWPETHARTVH